jgi:hypothetical protein
MLYKDNILFQAIFIGSNYTVYTIKNTNSKKLNDVDFFVFFPIHFFLTRINFDV